MDAESQSQVDDIFYINQSASDPHKIQIIFIFIFLSWFVAHFPGAPFQELFYAQEKVMEETNKSRGVVLAFYKALKTRDVGTVRKILAPDLEWWFHGPPTHQFMMLLLTGASSDDSFRFEVDPRSVSTFGSTVVVEGCDHKRSISWVHAWTVTNGIITQVREYFNTSLTVTRLGNSSQSESPPSNYRSSSSSSSSSTSSTADSTRAHCPSIWESSFSSKVGKSVPGLLLVLADNLMEE